MRIERLLAVVLLQVALQLIVSSSRGQAAALPEPLRDAVRAYSEGASENAGVLPGRDLAKRYLENHPNDAWGLYLYAYGEVRLGFFDLNQWKRVRQDLEQSIKSGLPAPQAQLAKELLEAIPMDPVGFMRTSDKRSEVLDRIKSDFRSLVPLVRQSSTSVSDLGTCLASAGWARLITHNDPDTIRAKECVLEIAATLKKGWTSFHPNMITRALLSGREEFPPRSDKQAEQSWSPRNYFVFNLVTVLEEVGGSDRASSVVVESLVRVIECRFSSMALCRESDKNHNLTEVKNAAYALSRMNSSLRQKDLRELLAYYAWSPLSSVINRLKNAESVGDAELVKLLEDTLQDLR